MVSEELPGVLKLKMTAALREQQTAQVQKGELDLPVEEHRAYTLLQLSFRARSVPLAQVPLALAWAKSSATPTPIS